MNVCTAIRPRSSRLRSGVRPRGLGRWRLALLIWLGATGLTAQPTREYDLKAVFLFNFTQFAEWPEAALGPADRPFVIGVLGDDPFGPVLDAILRDERANGRPLIVRRFQSADQVSGCQILFVGRGQVRRYSREIAAWHARHILTVTDGVPGVAAGCIVEFLNSSGKVRLRIDQGAADRAGISISSKLLRLAERVGDAP